MIMENKMTWGGIGPKLALITLPYIILSIFIINRDPGLLKINFVDEPVTEIVGYTLLAIGFIFYLASAYTFLKHFKKGNLITQGPYSLCRNPIYSTFIVFIIPALSLIFQSGMIFTIDLVLYLNFKIAIHGEYVMLRKQFGDEYDRYEKSVNEVLPIPKFRK
jgi:protein-S-isoprenylcysteine O-methyltransferase Ste14